MKIYAYRHERESANSDPEILDAVRRYLLEKGRAEKAEISVLRDEYGKPHICGADGIFVSVTHAQTLKLVAVAQYEIGIDAEKKGRPVKNPGALARRYFCSDEAAFLGENPSAEAFCDMWVAKEAMSKLLGKGIPCMKQLSVFSDKVEISDNNEYDGFIVKIAKYTQ